MEGGLPEESDPCQVNDSKPWMTSPPLSSLHRQTPKETWGTFSMGQDENKTSQVLQSLSLKRPLERPHLLHCWWRETLTVNGPACVKSWEFVHSRLVRQAHSCLVSVQLSDNLNITDQSLLGKFVQGLFQCLMRPLILDYITFLKAEAKANNYIRNWQGLPGCLSNTAPLGRNTHFLSNPSA